MRFFNNLHINDIAMHSKEVRVGSLFFSTHPMDAYVAEAIANGATAVVSENCPPKDLPAGVKFIQVDDMQATLREWVAEFFEHPERKLKLVGITGTKGKTTTTFLSQYLLERAGLKAGMISSIWNDTGKERLQSTHTTPCIIDIYRLLASMVQNDCSHVAMEMSSHGIEQKRTGNLQFESAIFTNLGHDHLDYHKTSENYFNAKAQLFLDESFAVKNAIINADDPHGQKLIQIVRNQRHANVVTFGINSPADLRAEITHISLERTEFRLYHPSSPSALNVTIPYIGTHNVLNTLAALSLCYTKGFAISDLIPFLREAPQVPGRLQKVHCGQPFSVFVDFAHTENALHNVLTTLKSLTQKRLLVVFGCGGERDKTKRPLMTRAVQTLADTAWATSDNPRSESIDAIFNDMKAGVTNPSSITWIPDRKLAIHAALQAASPRDCLIIAGKGHETYQEINGQKLPFDDTKVVEGYFKKL
jgi:UDP-N-acetylmuramoyl-L-alanyl-D-glutamate--2,6-diaminopimelate ligase